jgi:inosine-uridine nucleoside N-ribohydrolase
MLMSAMLSLALATQASETSDNKCNPTVKILLDTDPGGDDAFAMLWLQSLAKQCLVEIVGVTTASGNVASKYTFANASKLLTLGGFDQVEVGRAVPLPPRHQCPEASHIHGVDGMGGLSDTLPPPKHDFETAPRSDDMIIKMLNEAPVEIMIVEIGHMNNMAAADRKSHGILAKAKEIVIMGGTFHYKGNTTSHAEFNIYCNPVAAPPVFSSRDDIVVLPLDVTHQIIFTDAHADTVVAVNPQSDIAKFVKALSEFMISTTVGYRQTEGVNGFLVHDAATLAYLFYPETLLFRRAEVSVETRGKFARGQTLIDSRHSAKTEANAWVALEVDQPNLLAILTEDFKILVK